MRPDSTKAGPGPWRSALFLQPTHQAQQDYRRAKAAVSHAATSDGAFIAQASALERASPAAGGRVGARRLGRRDLSRLGGET